MRLSRTFILSAFAAIAVSLAACAQSKKENQKMEKNNKTLVAYFSATGTTRRAAEKIAREQGADLFEIEPVQPYTAADLDWQDKQSRSSVEMNDPTSRPAIKDKPLDVAQYDTIYVGFPIWWYIAPTIVNTFLEKYPLDGKTVIPFATSGGSSITKSAENLKKTYPKVNWKEGILMN